MDPVELKLRINPDELKFTSSRSSGPGGQNVNKVNTKIELRFNVLTSTSLSQIEKDTIMQELKNRINSEGELLIISQSTRSQLSNRKNAEDIFYRIVSKVLTPLPERRPTKPSRASKEKRVDEKKKRGLIKGLRRTPRE
ncbi:MAG TPA: alternative ribosome rescue aminoacyl-tRNA hydrolase ArfB [Bacteroidales bacterium]|nr:alternative ribosome rescue aminoacyl-tRNA hydrolase ArfB [Bacteroidales bacterium]